MLSPGRSIGLRMIPMARDLRFAWEEMPQQLLDEQAQKMRESLHAALIELGAADRRRQRLHRQRAAAVPASRRPLVRGAEPAAKRRPGAPARRTPNLQYLMVHNIDTLGADVDPVTAGGWHMRAGAGHDG